jgi:hypothetical protein
MTSNTARRHFLAGLGATCATPLASAESTPAAREAPRFLTDSFVPGREYFVLRAGRVQMIVQADTSGQIPGLLYLLFNSEDNRQSHRKAGAFHFAAGDGFLRSALEVELGGYAFTALGYQTETRWVEVDGVPAIEAAWWAGGLKVVEQIWALDAEGRFIRRIELTSADLGAAERCSLRLSLPPGPCETSGPWLVLNDAACSVALSAPGGHVEKGALEIGPFTIEPGQSLRVDTLLSVQIGGAGALPDTFADALEPTRQAWRRGAQLNCADSVLSDIFNKSRRGLPAMVAPNGVMNAGIFEYGAQWVRDTSNTLLGLVHSGQFEQARAGFSHVLRNMVNADGGTMIEGGYASPDREQFDQMGELIHALKAYRDWSGDETLISEHRSKLVALIERPLRPEFRHSNGLLHNRREFWERTTEDGCELAYQTYVVLGLRDAAALAGPLGAAERAAAWRAEAARLLDAMLASLVEEGRLIKRRSATGEWIKTIDYPARHTDVPQKTERIHLAEPDATLALPIAYGLVDPGSDLARKTLKAAGRLWNARWFGGGYERYHSSGQCDQPGPWTLACCFMLRALHDAGEFTLSRRALEYMNTAQGGRSGSWFEEVPLARSQAGTAGILPWVSGELSLFVVRHVLGVRFEGDRLVLRPALYPDSSAVRADLRFRNARLELEVPRPGHLRGAVVNGKHIAADKDGAVRLPAGFSGGTVRCSVR